MTVIEIPIKWYEEDIDKGSAKEMKKEILDLFANYNQLHSKDEYNEIEFFLHQFCKTGNLELIKICLSKTIVNESKDMVFKINETNKTASLYKILGELDHVIIPRSFKHESTDYLITSIFLAGENSKNVKTIEFSKDSEVNTIYSMSSLNIQSFNIPSSLIELKDGFCKDLKLLTNISISPLNDNFTFKENKYLLGKSDKKSDNFDILLFANRDIEDIFIPSNVTKICNSAFNYCKNLTKVEIPTDSNLQIIGDYAFYGSGINEIFIPSNVTKICNSAFKYCKNLTKVEIPTDSNLEIIEESAFEDSNINEIFIPSKVTKICYSTFSGCHNLTKIKIPTDSNLHTICSYSLSYTNINEIYFPKNLIKFECVALPEKLTKITISQLNDRFIFKKNKYLLFKSDKNSDNFDVFLYALPNVKEILIPSNIINIHKYAFSNCKQLTKVEFSLNSSLQIIENFAFKNSNIEKISIPSTISIIKFGAFAGCKNLKNVVIPENSKLETIEKSLFVNSGIRGFVVPSNISIINDHAFTYCFSLQIIEIGDNSKLQILNLKIFSSSSILMISASFLESGQIKITK